MTEFEKKHVDLSKTAELGSILRKANLNTVCESALCPNISECFQNKTATFLIAGKLCTRNCRFCAVDKGAPLPLDENEPRRTADMVKELGLKYVVITSVTRDDLPDGGAGHFYNTVKSIRKVSPETRIETLVPDFQGKPVSLKKVFSSNPDVLSHNLETVPGMYNVIRPNANYEMSLNLLFLAGNEGLTTKSGLMLGLGEKDTEVLQVMDDLRSAGCKILTLGQYLAPSLNHYHIREYISGKKFEYYKSAALQKGFSHCASGTYVRSSYMAESMV